MTKRAATYEAYIDWEGTAPTTWFECATRDEALGWIRAQVKRGDVYDFGMRKTGDAVWWSFKTWQRVAEVEREGDSYALVS